MIHCFLGRFFGLGFLRLGLPHGCSNATEINSEFQGWEGFKYNCCVDCHLRGRVSVLRVYLRARRADFPSDHTAVTPDLCCTAAKHLTKNL